MTAPRQSHSTASMTRSLRRLPVLVAEEGEVVVALTILLLEVEVEVELVDLKLDMEPLANRKMFETFSNVVMKDTERGGIKL